MQNIITNRPDLEALIATVKAAQNIYATFSQEQVDTIFKKSALAANAARIPLASINLKRDTKRSRNSPCLIGQRGV
jgi:acetaldehyde dehydrogenase / alcohol dehydrogenase